MNSKEKDHNQGEKDGFKSSGFDAWVQQFNLFSSEHYNKGFDNAYKIKKSIHLIILKKRNVMNLIIIFFQPRDM